MCNWGAQQSSLELAVSDAMKCNGKSAFDWITSEYYPGGNFQISLGLDALSDMVQEEILHRESL